MLAGVFFGELAEEGTEDGIALADAVAEPLEEDALLLIIGQRGATAGEVEPVAEFLKGEGDGNGEIKALGESIHGDADMVVGLIEEISGEAILLGAEAECDGLIEGKLVDGDGAGAEAGGDDAVAELFQIPDTELGVGLIGEIVAVEMNPFEGAHGDIAVEGIGVAIFDDMEILYAEAFAGTHGGAGVMGLVDILKDNAEVVGTILDDRKHALPTLRRDEGEQMIHEGADGGGVVGEVVQ